jgi:hypothetical protein
MTLIVLTAIFLQSAGSDPFLVQAELQGLYDEMSQATLQFQSDSDVDDFLAVIYTPDWTLTGADGQRHSLQDVRTQAIAALSQPRLDSKKQSIQKLSFVPGGASVVVTQTTAQTVVDDAGKYGPKGRSHVLSAVSVFRDDWVGAEGQWKLKSRQQVGQTKTLVDDRPTR